jgi:hypothetical protein
MSGVEAVLQRDEVRLFGDPLAIGRGALLFGGLLVGLHVLYTAFSPSFSSNSMPSREAPMTEPMTWWYGTPVNR